MRITKYLKQNIYLLYQLQTNDAKWLYQLQKRIIIDYKNKYLQKKFHALQSKMERLRKQLIFREAMPLSLKSAQNEPDLQEKTNFAFRNLISFEALQTNCQVSYRPDARILRNKLSILKGYLVIYISCKRY